MSNEAQGDYWLRALSMALVSVAGTPIHDTAAADKILATLPTTFKAKVWALYCDGIPNNRFFSTKGLFTAPEVSQVQYTAIREEEALEGVSDHAVRQMEQQFGSENVQQAQLIERKLFESAKKRGVLRPATPEEV